MVDFKRVFLFLVVGLFMISFVSAMEIDNIKEYDATTRESYYL